MKQEYVIRVLEPEGYGVPEETMVWSVLDEVVDASKAVKGKFQGMKYRIQILEQLTGEVVLEVSHVGV